MTTPAAASPAGALARVSVARRQFATGIARQRRQAAALSLREVAEALGVDVATCWRWEHGRATPRPEAARRWMELLDAIEAEDGP